MGVTWNICALVTFRHDTIARLVPPSTYPRKNGYFSYTGLQGNAVTNKDNIRVIPDTLNNIIVAVGKGQYRIPQFQREYVWEKTKVLELFDSIYREFPIGSFFLWKAERKHNHLFRHSIDLNIAPVQDDDDVCFILDGQQRITSLYVTLLGLTARGTDYGRICFDVNEEKFTHREPDGTRYISLHDIWQSNLLRIAKRVPEAHQEALGRCYEILRTYPVSIVQVGDKDLPAVCKIFQRINQGGKRLDRFDLIAAMTYSPDFDLRQKFREDVLEKLEQKAFGKISPAIATQLMALVMKGACTEKAEFSLLAVEIQAIWRSTVASILLAADTLRSCVGVQNAAYLPYDALLTLLAYFYAKSGQRALSEAQQKWVQRWFWRASFSQHYGSGGPTKMGRDKDLFDRLLEGSFPRFEPVLGLTADTLVKTKMTWPRAAIRNAFLCLLATLDPVHLINNSRLDLVNGGISDFTSPEKHHIFPRAFLAKHGAGDIEVHALPNFCFLSAELNKRILDERPSAYFPKLQRENVHFIEAAKTHLIPTESNSGIATDDYLQFLKTRSELILAEIERVTGLSTAPPENQRHKVIERLEGWLRDCVHSTLNETHGPHYWKRAIPEDVRTEVEKRIAGAVRKQGVSTSIDFDAPREKLNFCSFGDYSKIIHVKSNWPAFEGTFRRWADFERHMEALAEFRNALMHNRLLTEISLRAGELAIVWLEAVMRSDSAFQSDEVIEGDGAESGS